MIMKDGGILPRVTVGEGFFFFLGGDMERNRKRDRRRKGGLLTRKAFWGFYTFIGVLYMHP